MVVTIRPARYKPTGEVLELDITARACAAHADLVTGDPRHPDALRRKHARDVEQMALFDAPGARSAIHV